MDPIVHFEIPVNNIQEARQFYEQLFGWQTAEWPMNNGEPYIGVRTTPVDDKFMHLKKGAINGGMVQRDGADHMSTLVVHVQSIDETLAKAVEAGGEVVQEKMAIDEMGFYARFKDPQDNVIGLWEDSPEHAAKRDAQDALPE